MDLSEYKRTLRLDPQAKNDGTWYSRSNVQHDGRTYGPGAKLPSDMTNEQIAQLLDVNALTSVKPKEEDVVAPIHSGAPNQVDQQPTPEEVNRPLTDEEEEARRAELKAQQEAGEQGQAGSTRVDENGNPVDENGNPVQ